MKRIYLDNAASTPVFPEVLDEINRVTVLEGNPSSVHYYGRMTRSIIDNSRSVCAQFFGCEISELIFTSGATESTHLAMIGCFLSNKNKSNNKILISSLSHISVIEAANFLNRHFGAEVKYLPINKEGLIDYESFDLELFENVLMVVIEHGNSEVGLIQPTKEIGTKIQNLYLNIDDRPVFIVDCAASIDLGIVSLKTLNADFIVLSGEKFGGPAGIGILLKKKEFMIAPIFGGGQEFGFRGGTENLLGIAGISKALEVRKKSINKIRTHLLELHKMARDFFQEFLPEVRITTPIINHLPHVFHFILNEMDAVTFITKCDLAGVSLSAGSACSSGSVSGSQILKNMGFSDKDSLRGIRMSFGSLTSPKELQKGLEIMRNNIS